MTTAKDLMPAYIAGTAGQSGALFADNGTLRDPGSAGGGNREHEYSGSVADTCRGGIDTFSFPDCRHSLGGAASPRLISPAASVYAVSRDVEVIVVRVGLIVAPGSQATSFAPLSVFETANFTLGERRYEVRVISETGGHA
jgi:hypothetical protein